jgi:signal peptidase I
MSVTSGAKRKEGVGEFIRPCSRRHHRARYPHLLFQPFNIPSGSMKATLLVGTSVRVEILLRLQPFLAAASPTVLGRIGDFAARSRRHRGVPPAEETTDYIKRVIGCRATRQMIDGILNINGKPVPRERSTISSTRTRAAARRGAALERTLPNGVSYTTLDLPYNLQADNTEVYRVPPDNYFMMGDNRHNSTDSRFPQVGYVPFENIVGRAQLIFFSVHEGERAWEIWRWPFSVRWSRLFTIVR